MALFPDNPYASLPASWPDSDWIATVAEQGWERLSRHPHGDLPRWLAAVQALPRVAAAASLDLAAPVLGEATTDADLLRALLMELHPWRKGPLRLGGVTVDSEWRSDWKWCRIAPRLDLRGLRILDVGCGNGYYGLRMLGAGAELVVGVDPTPLYVMQWLACRHFSGDLPNYVLPLAAEDLPDHPAAGFDAVFSLGVLYHRRDPLQHLGQLRSWLRPEGLLVLESLLLTNGREAELLRPPGRYARMRNVWAVPGIHRLSAWLEEAGFRKVELLDVTVTTTAEQRSTPWMRFESLEQALDPADSRLTVEGHPAPARALLVATA
ncbi:MAG: tRNA 5-methoxyuridine(34)/uridine 5-oxyacetic acid(34) synthase CmoB [Lysobacterales bacterium]